jgi:hypothetical protein
VNVGKTTIVVEESVFKERTLRCYVKVGKVIQKSFVMISVNDDKSYRVM